MNHVTAGHDNDCGRRHVLHGKSASFWGLIMIAVGGLWLLFKLLPFILGFAVPALLIYAGYTLIARRRAHEG